MHDFLNMEDMDIDKVDQAMKSMDKKFNTQFYIWIRNENNVDYISYYLRRVIVQYEQQNFHSIYRAIRWLVNGWSVQRTAELLIKLFYHWGVGDHKFANLVKNITINWPLQPTLIDLVVTLVIGERSSKTARFIYQLTTGWSLSQKLELIHAVSTRLRWSERYFKHFLLQLACLGERSWESKRSLVNSIRQSFNSLLFIQIIPQLLLMLIVITQRAQWHNPSN
ncbi:hypothetical protein K502DRAFT_337323 [Neoconidiobolus thromboides FSU 785]|nr:hypothetical protein K502DRAFT_337323 [Neoconidiobolus thromboides FSU 785]